MAFGRREVFRLASVFVGDLGLAHLVFSAAHLVLALHQLCPLGLVRGAVLLHLFESGFQLSRFFEMTPALKFLDLPPRVDLGGALAGFSESHLKRVLLGLDLVQPFLEFERLALQFEEFGAGFVVRFVVALGETGNDRERQQGQ